MVRLKKYLQSLIVIGCAGILSISTAAMAAKTPASSTVTPLPMASVSSTPDPNSFPVLANLVKSGAKIFYLGKRSGLEGWFIVKDGQVQISYLSPDGQSLLIGIMFGADGENITAAQVKNLIQSNGAIAGLIGGQDGANAGGPMAAAPQAAANAPAPAPSPAPTAGSPGEKLIHDLSGATGVVIGNTAAPELLMVMDPNCPHCQATWRALRDAVFKNSVRIKLIPIATPDTDNERAAGQLLHAQDPLSAWDKYVNGDKIPLAGTPDPSLIAAVRANHELVDSWNIHATPYMVYRAKDGTVKILEGEPEKVPALLNDLGS